MTHHLDLGTVTLGVGAHASREEGVCLLEAVAWWAEEPHSAHPVCVSPVLAAFGRALNDRLSDHDRAALVPLIPLLAGSVDAAREQTRAYALADAAVRRWAPLALAAAGYRAAAQQLQSLPAIVDQQTARDAAYAAHDAAAHTAAAAAHTAAHTAAAAAHTAAVYAAAAAAARWALLADVVALIADLAAPTLMETLA